MKKILNLLLLLTISYDVIFAFQPNLVMSTIFNIDGNGSNSNITEYTNGLGNQIQTKTKIGSDSDKVTCIQYDEFGRYLYSSKPFIDIMTPGSFFKGEIIDNSKIDNKLEQQLYNQYSDHHAFTRISYFNYPSGGKKKISGPGHDNIYGYVNSWIFGVSLKDTTLNITSGSYTIGNVIFQNGLITGLNSSTTMLSDLLDTLYQQFLVGNPFHNPNYFLSVTMMPDNKISEELKDLAGNTVRTLSAPDTNGVTGSKIIANYIHDPKGQILKEIPPASTDTMHHSIYRYNTLGQLIYKRTPDGGEIGYNYRIDGQIDFVLSYTGTASQWDKKTIHNYDNLGRVSCISVETPATPENKIDTVIYYFYDNTDELKKYSVFSKIPEKHYRKITNLRGRVAGTITVNLPGTGNCIEVGELFSYNNDGLIERKILISGASPLIQETVFSYDVHGKLITETFYYSGDQIRKRNQYDELGRLSSVYSGKLQKSGSYTEKELVSYSYDPLGQLDLKTLSAMNTTYQLSYDYDIRNRLKNIQSPSGLYGVSQNLNYAKSGNIDSIRYKYLYKSGGIKDSLSLALNYQYDDLSRLKTVSGNDTSFNADYGYDAIGRITSKRESSSNLSGYNYYNGTNRLEKTNRNPTGQEYIYSKSGNLIVDFTKKMVVEYDWRDMPCIFQFYDTLANAGITHDSRGTYNGADLYSHLKSKVADSTLNIISEVIMLYNASGDRIAKEEILRK